MNLRAYAIAAVEDRNRLVAARLLLPWQAPARARVHAEYLAGLLREFRFGQAKAWWAPQGPVRVYIGRQGYIPVGQDGARFSASGTATERGARVLGPLYPGQRANIRAAHEAYLAWSQAMFDKGFEWHAAHFDSLDEDSEYLLHVLDTRAD